MKRLVLLGFIVVMMIACSKTGDQKTGTYVAKIDNKTITAEDVKTEMSNLPDVAKDFFKGPEGTSRFVNELVNKELLYLEAKKKGFDKDKNFERKMEEFKKIQLISQLLEKEIGASLKVTEQDVREYYDKHKDEFVLGNQVRISHILVKTEDEAKKVFDRLRQGEDFAKVAAATSMDKVSAKAGGDMGVFKRGELNRELEEVAFRLRKGEVSRPIPLKDGIHIIKVTDVKGTAMEFDKVKNMINQRLTAEKQKQTFEKYLEGLKKTYKIDINKEAVAKMSAEPLKPEAAKPEMPKPEPQKPAAPKPEPAKPEPPKPQPK